MNSKNIDPKKALLFNVVEKDEISISNCIFYSREDEHLFLKYMNLFLAKENLFFICWDKEIIPKIAVENEKEIKF